MGSKFTLPCTPVQYKQTDKWPKIRVRRDTYAILTAWAAWSHCSLAEIVERVVDFAVEHFEDEPSRQEQDEE